MEKIETSLNVNIGGIEMRNPVMTASGTFGYGSEYADFVDLNQLGAVVVKGVTRVPWPGNPIGGVRLYRRSIPFFIGLVIADVIVASIISILGLIFDFRVVYLSW